MGSWFHTVECCWMLVVAVVVVVVVVVAVDGWTWGNIRGGGWRFVQARRTVVKAPRSGCSSDVGSEGTECVNEKGLIGIGDVGVVVVVVVSELERCIKRVKGE